MTTNITMDNIQDVIGITTYTPQTIISTGVITNLVNAPIYSATTTAVPTLTEVANTNNQYTIRYSDFSDFASNGRPTPRFYGFRRLLDDASFDADDKYSRKEASDDVQLQERYVASKKVNKSV